MIDTISNKSGQSVSFVVVDDGSDGRRLDNFLISILSGVPHSRIYNLIRTGQVRVDSARANPKQRLHAGQRIRIPPIRVSEKPLPGHLDPKLKDAVRRVVFEDDFMVVIDKPAGIAVHAGTRHNQGFIEAMRRERFDIPDVELVHRLDKDTSGILVLAKNKRVLRDLHVLWRREQKDAGHLVKRYSALVKGVWTAGVRNVESNEEASTGQRKRTVQRNSSTSQFVPVQKFANSTLVDILLHTGKTHQARRHALQIGYPIAGDRKYGDRHFNSEMRDYQLKRLFLHAVSITIMHPVKQTLVTFKADLPSDLLDVLKSLNNISEKING